MIKIVSVTDLHLGYPQTKARVESFGNKIAKLPRNIRAVCLSGDTFTLAGAPVWKPMIERPLSPLEIEERRDISRKLVDEWALQLFGSIPKGIKVFMIPGNADILAYEYLAESSGGESRLQLADGKVFSGELPVNILGAGAITPDNKDAENILQNNAWYGGVIGPDIFAQKLVDLQDLTGSWRQADWAKAILMTHMPALGHVDSFNGQRQGSPAVLDFIHANKPLLHLAGHMHDGPFTVDKYDPWSVIANATVSINAGGGPKHDSENGVQALLIDAAMIAEGREQGRIKQAAAGAITRL